MIAEREVTRFACPSCGETHSEVVFTGSEDRFALGGKFPVMSCSSCGFLWTHLPPDFDLEDWYERGYWQSEDDKPDSFPAKLRSVWRTWNGSVRPVRWINSGRVLDLGCGPAYDSAEMLEAGAKPIGLDTSRAALAMAAGKRVPGILASAEQLPLTDGCMDAVVMSQILEHMPDPQAVLAEAVRVLKPGGRILVLLPNSRSMQRRIFGAQWVNWHLPYHLWHFNEETLRSQLSRAGIEVSSCKTISPGEWFLLSTARRWPFMQPLLTQRYLSLIVRAIVGPALKVTDAIGAGDCLVVEAGRTNLDRRAAA